ncbi:MAG: hypothetical protein AAGI30_11140 [Planctomycetota bacterium]
MIRARSTTTLCIVFVCIIHGLISGCSSFGPASIRGGRVAYNEAITETGNQQLLGLIVKHRYVENMQMLAVSSVTANMRVSARVGTEFGIGPDENFSGNLVPLSTSVLVEENPTISYVPLEGEQFIREMLSPIPDELVLLLIAATESPAEAFATLIKSINGIPNRAFISAFGDDDQRFSRVIELLGILDIANAIHWRIPGAENEPSRHALILRWPPELDDEAEELLALLVAGAPPRERTAVLELASGGRAADDGTLHLQTRSIGELIRIAGASMDIAPEHLETGLARDVRGVAEPSRLIRIRGDDDRPRDAYVAVEHRGWWYWIDATDVSSKQYFKLLTTLISVRLADSVRGQSRSPVLTIPTSR